MVRPLGVITGTPRERHTGGSLDPVLETGTTNILMAQILSHVFDHKKAIGCYVCTVLH
jgi:hypothetical protein